MRKLTFLFLVAAFGPAMHAQTRVSVSQMDPLLASLHHKSDAKGARQLVGLELTERATSAWLERWETELPGTHTREALAALADASAFLDLPAADLPAEAPPDLATQEQIFSRITDYVSKTLHKLPNFSALRITTYYEWATPQQLLQQLQTRVYTLSNSKPTFRSLGAVNLGESKGTSLFIAGTWNMLVTYRDGLEISDTPAEKGRHERPPAASISTEGEFGPILYVVLGDAIHGEVTWGHWEHGKDGLLAVFHYEVPSRFSHYAVKSFEGGPEKYPTYQGEIAVDPASGTIYRITIKAEKPLSATMAESSILVEYGPVTIGGSVYICPVRAVALSKQLALNSNGGAQDASAPVRIYVNDVAFTQYHVFRAEARILPGNPAAP